MTHNPVTFAYALRLLALLCAGLGLLSGFMVAWAWVCERRKDR